MGRRVVTLLVLGGILAVGVAGAARLEVETDITRFLPEADDPRLGEVARRVAASELNRTVTLTVEAPTADGAAAAARALAERLAESPDVAWARSGPDEALQQAFYELYFPRRLGLAADRPERIGELLSDAALRARARTLKQRLSEPTGAFVRELAVQDPWLLFLSHLESMRESMQGSLTIHDGAFVTEDGRHGVVLLGSERSAFDTVSGARLEQDIAAAFAQVDGDQGGALRLEQSSLHRLALRGEESVRADVTRVTAAGSLGMVLFLLVALGSLRYLLLGSLPIASGVLAGVAASAFVFGQVHGLTLAFGATLIGVAVDYVAHLSSHHVLDPSPGGALVTARRLWPGLLLGGATTVAGVGALALSSIPAISEMALFVAVGVTVALLVTRYVVPPWLPPSTGPTRVMRGLAALVSRFLEGGRRHRGLAWALVGALAAVGLAGLLGATFEDDLRSLGAPDPDLIAEDERVRERVARVDAGRFVVAFGADVEEALARNDAVYDTLADARSEGLLARQRSLGAILPSAARQRAVRDAVLAQDPWRRTLEAYVAEGFVPEPFAPFEEALAAELDPLTLDHLRASPLASLAAPFVLDLDEGVAVLTFVSGVADPDAIARRLDAIDGVVWFDQAVYMEQAYRRFRTRTMELLGVGLLLVCLLVAIRYRNARDVAVAVGPAVLAGALALAVVALFGRPLTLVHVLTVMLVLSIGVDYGVFVVESARWDEGLRATMVGLVVACTSTILSFGALALSDNPAMRAMGVVTAIGVAAALLLAAAAWVLLRPESKLPDRSRR